MHNFFREQLRKILRVLAVLTIKKYKPGVVGIAGAAGKTSTKEAIFAVLQSVRKVRASREGAGHDIIFPLAILGAWEYRPSFGFWFRVLFLSAIQLVFKIPYPEVLILEYGAERPGDMKYLLDIARPHIGVLTAIGTLPPHIEFYDGSSDVFREKSRLIEALPATGFAVLNADDPDVMETRDRTRAHVITYGFSSKAEFAIIGFEYRKWERRLTGVSFKIEHGGSFVPIRLDGTIGRAPAYAVAAAAAVGGVFGIHLVKVAEAISYFTLPLHRSLIVHGDNSITIIDDSYDASPISMRAALQAIDDCGGVRKIGVLGEMAELGKYTASAHEEIGKLAADIFDFLIAVGPRAKFIADAARRGSLLRQHIFHVDDVLAAIPILKKILKRRDVVLVTGSEFLELGRIVVALQAKPELKSGTM